MQSIILIVIFTVSAAVGFSVEKCDQTKCPSFGLSHYRELDCLPILGSDGCCAERFDCPRLDQRRENTDKCYFKGKEFTNRERVPTEETDAVCLAACFCDSRMEEMSDFVCAELECPENFGEQPPEGCWFKYENIHCCATGWNCQTEAHKTCDFNGFLYKEGERVYNGCSSCICKNGDLECVPTDCGLDIKLGAEMAKGGTPVYYGRFDCNCPFDFIFPSESVEIVPGNGTSDLTCQFGKRELKLGDELSFGHSRRCVKCACEVPPLISCIQDPHCK